MGETFFSPILLLLTESCGGTGHFGSEESVCEFLNLVDLAFLGDQETEVRVLFPEFFKFDCDGGDAELLLEFPAAILKGLVMQENYIGPGEFLARFSRNPDVEVLVQGRVHEPELLVLHFAH